MTSNEPPFTGRAFLRSHEIFRPRIPNTEWPPERALPSPLHQANQTTTIAQDIEDLLQFLDDFTFPNSPECKPTPSSSTSIPIDEGENDPLAPGRTVNANRSDSHSILLREEHVSPVVAATFHSPMAPPLETEEDLGVTIVPSIPFPSCQRDDDTKDDGSIHPENNDTLEVPSDSLSDPPPPPLEEEERRAKLTQWVRQIRAAVQETVQHYRQYIHLLQQQKASSGNTTAEPPQELLLSYETELHALHCQLQQIQHEYQQTVQSLQSVIEQQSQTIQHLQMQPQTLLAENTSPGTASEIIATPLRRVSPSYQEDPTHREGAGAPSSLSRMPPPTPLISPNSSSSSNKENRSATSLPQPNDVMVVDNERSSSDHGRLRSLTAAARILPTEAEHCKRIQFHNGTIQEIYYAPPSSKESSKRHRRILYDIIRFPNGDIKMTTTPTTKGEPEIYYYYAASGIIQMTYSSFSCKTVSRVTEYHYPNGQVEYHHSADGLVVVKFPNGKVLHHSRRSQQAPTRHRNESSREQAPDADCPLETH